MQDHGWRQDDFDRLAALTAADFDGWRGADLVLADVDGAALTVVAVERLQRGDAPDRPGGDDRPFDVVLETVAAVDLAQGMYAVDLPGTGVVPLFLVPIGRSEHGHRYVASFG